MVASSGIGSPLIARSISEPSKSKYICGTSSYSENNFGASYSNSKLLVAPVTNLSASWSEYPSASTERINVLPGCLLVLSSSLK